MYGATLTSESHTTSKKATRQRYNKISPIWDFVNNFTDKEKNKLEQQRNETA